MAFGQQLGPPASNGQVQELLSLLREAGYDDFRAARHPLDLTQRQANGRFTRDEAATLIDQLWKTDSEDLRAGAEESPKIAAKQQLLRVIPAERLAAELQSRGWIVIAP